MKPAAATEIKKLRALLGKPRYQAIDAEFQARNRPPRWYSLFAGPANVADLADRLKHRADYDVLYRQFPRTTHGGDFMRYLVRVAPGKAGIKPLRSNDQYGTVATLAASFILKATRLMLKKFQPGEDIRSWYAREVRPRFMALFPSRGPSRGK